MRIFKKILKVSGIILVVLVSAAFIIPVVFKKQIQALIKKEANKSLDATVDFKNVQLSFFRHFPKVSVSIEGLSIVGINEFSKDTLVAAKSIDATAGLMSIINGKDIRVSGLYLEQPRIHALVNKEGKANWDIAKKSSTISASADTAASVFKLTLKKYEINDGYIQYKDESSNISTEIEGINHTGSGDLTNSVFTLATATNIKSVNFTYDGIPYLVNTQTVINGDVQIDNSNSKYTFKTDDIALNNLKLSAAGFFQLATDSSYNMDITVKSPSNSFRDILSLIPAIYKNDFDKIKTDGKASVEGFVKGTYSPQQIPAYMANIEVQNGSFQYPDLPKPVKNIQIALQVSNTDGKTDNTVIDLSKGHLEMDNEPFDFRFLFKNPETIKYIDAAAKGKLDLSQLSQFIKLAAGTKLAGTVWADAFAKGNMAALENKQGPFTAGGFFDIKNLFYTAAGFPEPVQNGNIKMQLTNNGGIADNTTADITAGHIEIGKDPVDFSLQVSKPMSDINFTGSAKGQFTLEHIKQFIILDPGTALSGLLQADIKFAGNKAAIDKGAYDKININGNTNLTNVKYVSKDYPGGINIPVANATFNPQTVTINNFSGTYLQSEFSGSGTLNNIMGYMMKNEPLKGTINASVDKLNLNEWMGTPAETTSSDKQTAAVPFQVPANLNLLLNAKAGQVKYDKVVYNNINGTLLLANETVKLQDVKAEALDGTLLINGSYSTLANKKDPDISIAYDVKGLDIQKTFLSFNTVKALMPVGQFLAGKISSQLTMNGKLNGNMMPDFNTLTGKGNLLLLEGVLQKFAPLEKIAASLQINELKEITVKDVKTYIEFANGKVLVKPFTVKIKNIEMQIGGTHGLDKNIDYIIAMKVPRKYIGNEGNNLLNNLVAQANTKGIPVKLSETVNLVIKLTGSMANPTIKTDLADVAGNAVDGLKQQAIDFAKTKVDSAKNTIKDSANAIKNQVVKDLKDEIKNKLAGNKDSVQKNTADSTKKNVEKTIKNTINNLFNKKKKAVADSTNKQ